MTELSNWGRWGPDDTKGTVNLITPEKRIEAAGLVRSGVSVSLARELDHVEAPDNPYPLDQEVYATGQAPSARIAGDRLAVRFHGRADVTLEFRESSWMPANYSERLSEAEIKDLLAFLSRQSVRPVETAEGGALQ